jgi:PPE-SVP subfamily C-terminal region
VINLLGSQSGIFVDPELGTAGLAVGTVAMPYDIVGALTGSHTDDIVSGWAGIQAWPGTAPVPPTPFPVITNLAGGTTLSADLGGANKIGALSVPAGWTSEAPAIRPAARGLPAPALPPRRH